MTIVLTKVQALSWAAPPSLYKAGMQSISLASTSSEPTPVAQQVVADIPPGASRRG